MALEVTGEHVSEFLDDTEGWGVDGDEVSSGTGVSFGVGLEGVFRDDTGGGGSGGKSIHSFLEAGV